jgi:hypothetical protein
MLMQNVMKWAEPPWARKCTPRHIKLVVVGCRIIIFKCWLTCVFHETMSIYYATKHAYMNSNNPPYDMANSRHGIPIGNIIPILVWALFLCLSVMFTYKFRIMKRRTNGTCWSVTKTMNMMWPSRAHSTANHPIRQHCWYPTSMYTPCLSMLPLGKAVHVQFVARKWETSFIGHN